MRDHISASQINLYRMCSLKYKFIYIDQKPRRFLSSGLAFGSAFHSTAEWFNKRRLQGEETSVSQLLDIFEADWTSLNCETISYKFGDSKETLLCQGQNLLKLYYERVNDEKILAVEYPFEVPLVNEKTGETLDLPLVGIFDLVESGPIIADLKTAARKMSYTDVDNNLQLTAYSYAYWMKKGELPDLRLDVLLKQQTPKLERMPTSRTQKDHRVFFKIAKQILNGIQNQVFFPNPGWLCADCEYRQECWVFSGKHNLEGGDKLQITKPA
jgi:putative RecB family exonuclease